MNQHTQPLSSIAFHLGPLEVHWYGIIIGIGAFLGFLLASKEGKKRGISSETISDLLLLALPIAIITARIYYVLFELSLSLIHI